MMLYDFVMKVQAEHEAAKRDSAKEHAAQNHNRGAHLETRAKALWDVLTWAGFEGCEIHKVPAKTDQHTPTCLCGADWVALAPNGACRCGPCLVDEVGTIAGLDWARVRWRKDLEA